MNMKFNLKYYSFFLLIISIIIQFILVINYSGDQISDQAVYLDLAKQTSSTNSFYPSTNDIYSNFIFAPGYVNYLSIILKLFHTEKAILIINIILLLLINFEIFYLAKKYFSSKVAFISLILSCFYSTYYGIILYTSTELLFTSLSIGAICLFTKEKLYNIIFAGIFLGLANWVRPFLPVYLIIILLITIFVVNRKIVRISIFSLSLFITILTIGLATQRSSSFFLYQSSTGGVNLIMGASDMADGSYNSSILQKGNAGYIQNEDKVTFKVRDAQLKKIAFNWIVNNPIKYLKLVPKKIFYMYAHDFHALAPLSGDMTYNAGSRSNIISTLKNFPNLIFIQWIMIYNQLFYFLIIILSFIGFFRMIKLKNKIGIILGLVWVLGTGLTIVTVGGSRYHFPYMPILILLASVTICCFFDKRNINKPTIV